MRPRYFRYEHPQLETIHKQLVIVIAILAMTFSLVACGGSTKLSKDNLVGMWKREESFFSEQYGCDCTYVLVFNDDGTVIEQLLNNRTAELLDVHIGTWMIEDNTVRTHTDRDPSNASTPYEYENGNLVNGGDFHYVKQ